MYLSVASRNSPKSKREEGGKGKGRRERTEERETTTVLPATTQVAKDTPRDGSIQGQERKGMERKRRERERERQRDRETERQREREKERKRERERGGKKGKGTGVSRDTPGRGVYLSVASRNTPKSKK